MTRARHIVIFEPEATGHQMYLLRFLLESIAKHVKDRRITLLTSAAAAEHPDCRRIAEDFSGLLTLHVVPPTRRRNRLFRMLGAFYERQWQQADACDRGLAALKDAPDFILLPHLEAIGLLQLAIRPRLFRARPWAAVAIAIRFHHRRVGIQDRFNWQDRLQAALFRRIVRDPHLVCLGSVNPYLEAAAHNPKVRHCPDPSTATRPADAAAARAFYGIRPETCAVLVFGFIDKRKCLDVLMNAAASVPGLDITVLAAGRQHPGHMTSIMQGAAAGDLRQRGRLIEVNRFIDDESDPDPFYAADIVWVFYERQFVVSSSVLVRAARSGRAVIARRQGVIGRLVDDLQCGLTVASEQPDDVAAALTTMARDPALRQRTADNGARGFAGNTPENFARPIVDAINLALPAPVFP